MKKKFTTNLDEELISAIKIQAIKDNTNVSAIMEQLIKKYLNGEINFRVDDK